MSNTASPLALRIAALAEYAATSKGYTVRLHLDAAAYLGPEVDRILYKTPENKGVGMTIAKSLTEGKMDVYTTPESRADAERVIAQIESATR